MSTSSTPEYRSIEQACAQLNRKRRTIGRLIIRGDLEAIKTTTSPQGRVRITKTSLDEYAAKQAAEHGEQVAS